VRTRLDSPRPFKAPVLITPTSMDIDPATGEIFVTELGPGGSS
jgi:hypothetical protein